MKIHLIVGARPNFMKIAPLYRAFKKYPEHFHIKLIHTGQHYDEKMSKVFFTELNLPEPDVYLGVGSGSHGAQTAKIMESYEPVLLEDKPDWIIVAGDVNSTLACALDAVKLHIKVAHLEAGLRSFDRSMPEEINRLATDSISDLLLTPSIDGNRHLIHEGVFEDKIRFVGNIMIDSLTEHKEKALQSDVLNQLNALHRTEIKAKNYCLVTLHRPSNVDTPEGLKIILNAFEKISVNLHLIFPIHPRTLKNIHQFGFEGQIKRMKKLIFTDPIGYYDFMYLQMNAKFILTDSGGIQEESTYFGVPCLTLRENTERPVTISQGTNQLVALETDKIIEKAEEIIRGHEKKGQIPELWDGQTAQRIVEVFLTLRSKEIKL